LIDPVERQILPVRRRTTDTALLASTAAPCRLRRSDHAIPSR
jgi:hypothetical protein